MSAGQSYRINAILVGVFYIVATVAGVIGFALIGTLSAEDYLTDVSARASTIEVGALLLLVMGLAVAAVAVSAYPVLRRYNSTVAVGYVVARTAEGVLILGHTVVMLVLLWVGDAFVGSGAAQEEVLGTAGDVLLAVDDVLGYVAVPIVFSLGALLFYAALYLARLVPRWLAGWGLASAALWLTAGVLMTFDVVEPDSTAQLLLAAPIGVQEMVLAGWLIVRGFRATPALDEGAPEAVYPAARAEGTPA